MRENTRCEVEEPISTPTERMQISSSPSSVRPLLEKKIRPPSASFMPIAPHAPRAIARLRGRANYWTMRDFRSTRGESGLPLLVKGALLVQGGDRFSGRPRLHDDVVFGGPFRDDRIDQRFAERIGENSDELRGRSRRSRNQALHADQIELRFAQ